MGRLSGLSSWPFQTLRRLNEQVEMLQMTSCCDERFRDCRRDVMQLEFLQEKCLSFDQGHLLRSVSRRETGVFAVGACAPAVLDSSIAYGELLVQVRRSCVLPAPPDAARSGEITAVVNRVYD